MFEFKLGEVLNYPWFCISKIDDMVVITTKKIASRFFEAATLDAQQIKTYHHNIHKVKAIDFVISTDGLINTFNLNDLNIKFTVMSETSRTSLDEFYEELKIKNISDVFRTDYVKTNKVVFVTRNPIERFYTGFIEWVDSEVGIIINKSNVSQKEIDLALNEHIKKINYKVFSDEHMSLWNTFLINFITTNNIEKCVQIVNLNEPSHMKIFKKDYVFKQPSNKSYLNMWLQNSDNRKSIEELHTKLKFYFDLEMESYNKLLNINYKQSER